jgi:hypothetical protein
MKYDLNYDLNNDFELSDGKLLFNSSESYLRIKTTEEILDSLDIAEIERYLRKKKLERINSVRKNNR